MSDGAKIWRGLLHIDAALAKHGVPAMSPRWRKDAERFYLHPTAHQWTAVVGRGGGKNLMGIKCDIAESCFGSYAIPVGERHYQVNLSENKEEANKTLRITDAYLDLLDVPHTATTDTIEFQRELANRGIKILAARVGACSGWRAYGLTTQESAKWGDDAGDVDASAKAMTVTHRSARRRHFSSPLAKEGFFYEQVLRGEGSYQVLSAGPSWAFNTSISEEYTRELEPDEKVWRREYFAEACDSVSASLDAEQVRATKKNLSSLVAYSPCLYVCDFSNGLGDATCWAKAQWVYGSEPKVIGTMPDGSPMRVLYSPQDKNAATPDPKLLVSHIDAIDGAFAGTGITLEDIMDRIAESMHANGARLLVGDPHMALALTEMCRQRRVTLVPQVWSNTSKQNGLAVVRQWLREGSLVIENTPQGDRTRDEMIGLQTKITPNGSLTVGARSGGHDDRSSLILNLGILTSNLGFPGAPVTRSRGVTRLDSSDFDSTL